MQSGKLTLILVAPSQEESVQSRQSLGVSLTTESQNVYMVCEAEGVGAKEAGTAGLHPDIVTKNPSPALLQECMTTVKHRR